MGQCRVASPVTATPDFLAADILDKGGRAVPVGSRPSEGPCRLRRGIQRRSPPAHHIKSPKQTCAGQPGISPLTQAGVCKKWRPRSELGPPVLLQCRLNSRSKRILIANYPEVRQVFVHVKRGDRVFRILKVGQEISRCSAREAPDAWILMMDLLNSWSGKSSSHRAQPLSIPA